MKMGAKTKSANCFLVFAAMSEILLDSYEQTSLLNLYDHNLEIKLRNLKANFERTSAKAHSLFSEEEQLSFFNLIRIFEKLIESAKSSTDFSELTELIDAWLNEEVITVHSKKNFIETSHGNL